MITDAKSALSNNSISNDNKQKAIEQVVSAVKKLSLEDNSEGNAVKSNVKSLKMQKRMMIKRYTFAINEVINCL